ncbi:transporter [Methylobacterium sp. Leaf469]|jgi:predicted permease|uniref:AEC family transporter n=1 Tax=unclassified Methylobacterium TaxID=2615210 RepID=UPI00070167AE|nr:MULTISPECIES: AEC family transporter [unclassified Methylobacterium]KQP18928.1 transporter [Methylobacterium sp. Leaf100]KQP34661.1 transporter [Methylobacterium sp. Leaf102]KQU05732.1 transporter [Methylobacterium sp. Leaf469]USU33779.1 AEC family transporter [Methylobacterium sp. OTU13CASTA1]
MNAVSIIAPVFGIIVIGWGAALAGLLSERVSDGLSEYVFAIAVPALIIGTLTRPGLTGEVTWSYWIAYFGGAAVSWLAGSLIATRRKGIGRQGAVLHGFAASQSNTIFVGVPTILQAYGEEGAFPLFLLLAVHLPLMMGCATFLIEAEGDRTLVQRLRGLGLVLVKNPIFVSLGIGMALRLGGVVPTGIARSLIDGFGSTASTCALVALGAGLTRYKVLFDLPGALVIAVLKLVVHPLAVWLLATKLFSMPPAYAGVATLFAAMPVGINAYLLAVRYKAETGLVAASVLVSTLLAPLTTVLWLTLLGRA